MSNRTRNILLKPEHKPINPTFRKAIINNNRIIKVHTNEKLTE
jgi:hypothetical protein